MCWVTLFYPYSPNIRLRKDKSSQQYLEKICRTLSNILAYADIMDELHTGFRIAESSLKSQPPSYQSADIKDVMFFKRNCFFYFDKLGKSLLQNQLIQKIIIQRNTGNNSKNWYNTSGNDGYRNGCLCYLQFVNGTRSREILEKATLQWLYLTRGVTVRTTIKGVSWVRWPFSRN